MGDAPTLAIDGVKWPEDCRVEEAPARGVKNSRLQVAGDSKEGVCP